MKLRLSAFILELTFGSKVRQPLRKKNKDNLIYGREPSLDDDHRPEIVEINRRLAKEKVVRRDREENPRVRSNRATASPGFAA